MDLRPGPVRGIFVISARPLDTGANPRYTSGMETTASKPKFQPGDRVRMRAYPEVTGIIERRSYVRGGSELKLVYIADMFDGLRHEDCSGVFTESELEAI